MRIARFVGDPVGYVIHPEDVARLDRTDGWLNQSWPRWVDARAGTTDREVRIDVNKAYLIEEAE